ncbi:hypothetical protein VZ95_17135 [Elstera litoralis]|uniref:Phage tail assembly protein n=1 Tax=Elstera litoralis TaxID=552518 RepID=A0A0F3IP81_9PROT|nr:phage tail assembly protein [Elstera litoralis]KJV08540.1 hypothetical protein VZ95_17135 [Elstera litoralis]
MDKLTYTLATPVQFTASRRVEELHFSTELKIRDLKAFDRADGPLGATLYLLAALAGEPVELIEAISAEEYPKLLEFLRPFCQPFLGTGVS